MSKVNKYSPGGNGHHGNGHGNGAATTRLDLGAASVGARIREFCTARFRSDHKALAAAAGLEGMDPSHLRSVIRGQVVGREILDRLVDRLGRIEGVNGRWLAAGEGPMLTTTAMPAPAPAALTAGDGPGLLGLLAEAERRFADLDRRLAAVEELDVAALLEARVAALEEQAVTLDRARRSAVNQLEALEAEITRLEGRIDHAVAAAGSAPGAAELEALRRDLTQVQGRLAAAAAPAKPAKPAPVFADPREMVTWNQFLTSREWPRGRKPPIPGLVVRTVTPVCTVFGVPFHTPPAGGGAKRIPVWMCRAFSACLEEVSPTGGGRGTESFLGVFCRWFGENRHRFDPDAAAPTA